MKTTFNNVKILTEKGYVIGSIDINDSKFGDIKESKGTNYKYLMIPGFIDEHTHGAIHIDFATCKDKEEMEKLLAFYASQGVTSVFPTLLTEKDELIFKQLELIYEVSKTNPIIKGVHLEGPFLSKEFKGAQPESCLQIPTIKKIDQFIEHSHGLFRLMTIAPEVENAEEAIKYLTSKGIKVSMGHSAATFDDCTVALKNGATNITHCLNAMKGIHQHYPSIATAALYYDELYNEVIIDGIHVHPEMVEFLRKIKTTDKIIGITDSLMAAGLPDGNYFIGNTPITVKNHDCVLTDSGVRAGSTLTMVNAFKNVKRFSHLSDLDASKICSLNCAKFFGLDKEIGSIKKGKHADFILMDEDYNIKEVYINGKKEF